MPTSYDATSPPIGELFPILYPRKTISCGRVYKKFLCNHKGADFQYPSAVVNGKPFLRSEGKDGMDLYITLYCRTGGADLNPDTIKWFEVEDGFILYRTKGKFGGFFVDKADIEVAARENFERLRVNLYKHYAEQEARVAQAEAERREKREAEEARKEARRIQLENIDARAAARERVFLELSAQERLLAVVTAAVSVPFPPITESDKEECKDGEGKLCVICQVSHVNQFMLECGHTNVCRECIDLCIETQQSSCPNCREKFTYIKRIYG